MPIEQLNAAFSCRNDNYASLNSAFLHLHIIYTDLFLFFFNKILACNSVTICNHLMILG